MIKWIIRKRMVHAEQGGATTIELIYDLTKSCTCRRSTPNQSIRQHYFQPTFVHTPRWRMLLLDKAASAIQGMGNERNTLWMSTSSTSVQYLYARADIIGVHRVDERTRAFRSFDVHHFVLSKTRNVHFGSRWERVRRWCQRIQILRFHIWRPGKRHSLL